MTGTGNSVAVREPSGALAIHDGQTSWDPMQLAALGQLGIADAPDGDKQLFLHVSQRTGLDPFARQIYMIGRNEKKSVQRNGQWTDTYTVKWTIQTGIEGWRVIRDRAERRAGARGTLSRFTYYDGDGKSYPVWVRQGPPVAVEVTYTVRDANGETPYTSVLRFSEYVQVKNGKAIAQWAPDAKPVHMLEKCCEADVYRKAFPQDYSGVVLDDAMPLPEQDAPPERQRVTAEQARARAPQRVQAEVVTVAPNAAAEDAPWPGDAAPDRPARNADPATGEVIPDGDAGPTTSGASSSARAPGSASRTGTAGQSQSSASGSGTTPDDPRDAVIARFAGLSVTGPEIPGYLTRLSGRPYASAESLSRAAAGWFADRLGRFTSRDELEAAAVAAEARREQDAAAKAGDALLADGEVPSDGNV